LTAQPIPGGATAGGSMLMGVELLSPPPGQGVTPRWNWSAFDPAEIRTRAPGS
jgi:hypothetical protein